MTKSTPQCILKIKQNYPKLTGKNRTIADYLIVHPEEIVTCKLKSLAEKCRCDEAQFVRFCQKLGYSGFMELRRSVMMEILPFGMDSSFKKHKKGDSFSSLKADFLHNNQQTTSDTIALFQEAEFQQAGTMIENAGRIVLSGFGASGLVAEDLQIKLTRMGFHADFHRDPEMNKHYIGQMKEKDVLTVISFTGENKIAVDAAGYAKEKKAFVIGITNYPDSSVGRLSDLKLLTAAEENSFRLGAMGSRIAQLLVVDFLAVCLALRNMERTEKNLIQIHSIIHPE